MGEYGIDPLSFRALSLRSLSSINKGRDRRQRYEHRDRWERALLLVNVLGGSEEYLGYDEIFGGAGYEPPTQESYAAMLERMREADETIG